MSETIRTTKVLFDERSLNATQYSLTLFSFRHQATVQGIGLDPADVITFEVLHIESGTSDKYCGCFFNPGELPVVDGVEELVCYDCDSGGAASTPLQLTANNPVVVLNAPQGAIIRAKYSGPGLGLSEVWATLETDTQDLLPGQSGCPEGCCIPDPSSWRETGQRHCNTATGMVEALMVNNCGDKEWQAIGPITWEDTGDVRCNLVSDQIEEEQVNQCGDTRWMPAGAINWTDTGDVRCTSPTTTQVEQINDCGNTRWVAGPANEWIATGETRCNSTTGNVEAEEQSLCGKTRWVVLEAITWTATGDTRCNMTTGNVEFEEENSCGKTRWSIQDAITWTATGDVRCTSDTTTEVEEVNYCGQTRWVAGPANEWTATGETRCANSLIENQESDRCGRIRWTATAEGCGYVPSVGLPCGGSAFAKGKQPPDATVVLVDCDGYELGYIYPDPRADANVPVTDDCVGCGDSGVVLGYASRVDIPKCDDGKVHNVFDDNLKVTIENWPEQQCCEAECKGIFALFSMVSDDLEATFTDTSFASDGEHIVSWAWDFGDGDTSTVQNPVHTYTSLGTYNVVLRITDSNGCTSLYNQAITVGIDCSQLHAGFTFVENFLEVTFTDTSTTAPGETITTWQWDFGDGHTSSQQNPVHTYDTGGNYNVILTVTSSKGCINVVNHYLSVSQDCAGVLASFTSTVSGTTDYQMLFDASASTPATGNSGLSYHWDFGDGNLGTGQVTSHTYADGGPYTVLLLVEDNAGCSDDASASVTPQASDPSCDPIAASFTQVTTGMSVAFTDTSVPPTGETIASWAWDFGDGNTSTSQNPTHVYSSAGTFTVTLTVTATGTAGCTATTTDTVTTGCTGATAQFTSQHGPFGYEETFNATSSSSTNGSIVDYQWTFDGVREPSLDGDPTVIHDFGAAGVYSVSLTVVDNLGCEDTFDTFVRVINSGNPGGGGGNCPFDLAWAVGILHPGCNPGGPFSADVDNKPGYIDILSYSWDFGDGTVINIDPDGFYYYTYANSGTYSVTVCARWINTNTNETGTCCFTDTFDACVS